ncbi:MAG: preprotein translocase subunit Sec61beta [Candidatus Methanomethylicia archaeon]|nr:preprotein translocase subunit Sec61beta [Candidatus Methanomethylicia archaeon]MCX8169133.1 preprotein translocase subunit Sec61beta [Candidatus Methanomethylicia archaeon]MDW7988865.1 preprotein translocase subunit Sec61beta [Nitrososphaerota archaeon]
MSKRRKRGDTYMPITGAGLIRFFEEEIRGLRVTPIQILAFTLIFITVVMLGNMGLFSFIKI